MKRRYIFLIIGILVAVLSTSRILWMNKFHDLSHIKIENGQLDLRDWSAESDEILLLDGKWEFYPSTFIMDQSEIDEQLTSLIDVPGKWDEFLNDENPTPFGYGSYRLKLYVNPEEENNYSIFVPSVRSATELYVNGRLLAKSGEIGITEDKYKPKNLPFTASFTSDENGEIEIVIQATNFQDIRGSGVIRSVKFGSEAAMSKERNLSLAMQILASSIFLIHSIYALVLFFLGNRERRLLYFFVLLFSITLINLISNDEKLFHLLFDLEYDTAFQLSNMLGFLACFALLKVSEHENLRFWRKINPLFQAIYIGATFTILFLSPAQIIQASYILAPMALIAIGVPVFTVMRKIYIKPMDNLLLLFSIITVIHHFTWSLYWREIGISVVHYPFDLIISVVCFSSVWFKQYFKTHAETKKLAGELQMVNENKEQFLANTSHEFKNPLYGIINMSQSILLREKNQLDKKSVEELEIILNVGRRMSLLLNDLVDVTSIRDGNPCLQKDNIAIQPIVTGVIDMLKFMVDGKQIVITNKVPDDFPFVFADENRLIQILYNLLHNALKYTHEGEISIEAVKKNDHAFISVTDTGIGMKRDFLERLFQPYEQATNRTMNEGGLGLGLSISKQLVELHGGQLEVSSTFGKGSKFTFSLSLAKVSESTEFKQMDPVNNLLYNEQKNSLSETSIDTSSIDFLNMTDEISFVETGSKRLPILIVDDDPINLRVLQSILAEEYNVTAVTSAKEALKLLDHEDWCLVISDVMMPEMSGYELTREIRKRYSFTTLPVLLLTARSDLTDIQSGFLAGANDYVTKPAEMIELRARVSALTMIKNAVQEQLQLEAAWLQAQIQPHFLFNTINSILALSSIDIDRMNLLLIEFSEYLRSKFQFNNIEELISINEELKIVRSYLNIEQVRYGDRLNITWDLDDYNGYKIPFLTIQPLIENAIVHGIMKRVEGGKITIRILSYDKYLKVVVEDNGVGIEKNRLKNLLNREHNQTSIGLINTNQRLMRHFGSGLKITSTLNEGTTVSFIVNK